MFGVCGWPRREKWDCTFKRKKNTCITILRKWALQTHPDVLKETQGDTAAGETDRIFPSGKHRTNCLLNIIEKEFILKVSAFQMFSHRGFLQAEI